MTAFPTEFLFRLPDGLVYDGITMRDGKMRLARASDEVIAMGDYRAAENLAYSVLILLSRVILELGGLRRVFPDQVETLSGKDLLYLQDFYEKINKVNLHALLCSRCGHALKIDPATGTLLR